MVDRRVGTGRRLTAALLVIATVSLGMPFAGAHDFGGPSGGGDGPPPPPTPPCNSCPCSGPTGDGGGPGNGNGNPGGSGGKPVSFFNGAEEMVVVDMVVNSVFPIIIQRKYDSRATYDSALGYGWSFLHDRRLYEYPDNSVVVRHGCGTRDRYVFSGGSYVTPTGSMLANLAAKPDGSFQVHYLNGISDFFDSQGRLTASSDAQGNRHEYTYDIRGKLPLVGSSKASIDPTQPMTVAYNYRLTRIDVRGADGALTGRYVTFAYHKDTGRLTSVTADDGRAVTYQHDVTGTATLGNLTQVNGLDGLVAAYGYTDPLDPHNLTSITPAQGRAAIMNTYDDQDRVTRQEEGPRRMDIVYDVPYTRTTVTRTIRDPNGLNPYTAATVYEFDASGRVTKLTDPLGHETRYTYDAAKLLSRKEIWQKDGATLSLLQAIDWTYDPNGNKLTEEVQLDTGETITRSWTYDHDWIASEQVVSSAAPAKVFRTEYTFYYGADGRPVNVQSEKRRKDDGSFQTTTYSYDSQKRPLLATLPDGVQVGTEYTGDYLTRVYFAVGGTPIAQLEQRYGYDALGNRTKQWDARGNLTQYSYDDHGRLSTITNPLGQQSIYTRDAERVVQLEIGRTVADGEGQVTKFVHDSLGRLVKLQRKNDGGTFEDVESYGLDSEGRRVSVTDAEGRTTLLAYDLAGRLSSSTDPAGKVTQFSYDAAGNRVSIMDPLLHQVRYAYDDLGRLVRATEMAVEPNAQTLYAYDAAGNLTSVTDARNGTTTYQYDALSRNTRVTQPLGQYVEYFYDARSRIDYQVDAMGRKVDFDYETWGAPSVERYFASVSAPTPDRTVQYAYDNDGHVASVMDSAIQATAAYSTTYDALGRPYDETINYLPGGDRVLQRRYDRYANRSGLTLVDGTAVSYTYQHNKRNHMVTAVLGGATVNVTHFATGEVRDVSFPNAVTQAHTYRPNGPVETLSVTGPSGSLASLAYAYDDASNLDSMTDTYGLHDYAYDSLNRLTQVLQPAGYGLANEGYQYDGVGNRADASNPASYVHDANNRLTARPGLTYTYNDAGALTGRSDGATFTHDAANRLVQFEKDGTVASYLYDAAGRRIRKTVNGTSTWYLWEDNRLLAEYDAAGTRVRRYAYLPHSPAAVQVEDANGVYYAHNDNVHTALMLTGSAGQVTWRARRESFGKALVEEDVDANGIAVTNNLRFPGQVWDGESGLHYNVMRYFDPELGRYIEPDPIGLRGGINLYAYATGSPTTLTDPLGLYSWSDVFAAYRHYCGRSGTSWSTSFTSLSWVTDPVTGMTQYIQNLTAGMGGICQDATIPVNHSAGFQTTGADAALIGRHSFTLTGTLTTGCDCSYSFSGNVQSSQGWELYNFNPSNRSMPAEIATAIGRNTCFWGRPFRINITGSQSVQSSGKTGGKDTCCKG